MEMTDDEIIAIWESMPGGAKGFCRDWGYLQFARRLIGERSSNPEDLPSLKAELQWAASNNEDRPRTESAIRWALELVEELEEKQEEA
jgi:hypothetical protein